MGGFKCQMRPRCKCFGLESSSDANRVSGGGCMASVRGHFLCSAHFKNKCIMDEQSWLCYKTFSEFRQNMQPFAHIWKASTVTRPWLAGLSFSMHNQVISRWLLHSIIWSEFIIKLDWLILNLIILIPDLFVLMRLEKRLSSLLEIFFYMTISIFTILGQFSQKRKSKKSIFCVVWWF